MPRNNSEQSDFNTELFKDEYEVTSDQLIIDYGGGQRVSVPKGSRVTLSADTSQSTVDKKSALLRTSAGRASISQEMFATLLSETEPQSSQPQERAVSGTIKRVDKRQ